MLKQFPLQLDKVVAAASSFDVLNLDIIDKGPATAITELWVLHFGLACSLHGGVYAWATKHARCQRR